jgi:hypothetical protein
MRTINLNDPASTDPSLAELPPPSVGAVAVTTLDLLDEASDLPQPRYIAISDTQHISVQFAPVRASLEDISRWELRFGGDLITQRVRGRWFRRELRCSLTFGFCDTDVHVYAYIPARAATT